MMTHATSRSDREFRKAFEDCKFPPEEFNHEAHLRLAYVYLVENDVASARTKFRSALMAFLAARQIPASKFHETLTCAWVLATRHFMNRGSCHSFAEFTVQSQPLMDSKAMLTHYTRELLFSADARASFIEPDLEAIPH